MDIVQPRVKKSRKKEQRYAERGRGSERFASFRLTTFTDIDQILRCTDACGRKRCRMRERGKDSECFTAYKLTSFSDIKRTPNQTNSSRIHGAQALSGWFMPR